MDQALDTDYLVVGAGAAGMAFTDSLLTHSDATVTIVDRRHAPGGHWIDAYPFVRLHQPSTFYGVSSVPLGQDARDVSGTNAGYYELAGADAIRAFARHAPFPVTLVRQANAGAHVALNRGVALARGEIDVDGQRLVAGDAAMVTDAGSIELARGRNAEVLAFDLP